MKLRLFSLAIILGIILTFSTSVQAGSLTLRPDGVGTYTQYDSQFPASGEHWDKVDEETPDEDSTYIEGDSTQNDKDSYTLTDSGLPVGTLINSVTVYVRAKKVQNPPTSVATFIRTNGADFTGSENDLSTNYVTYSTVYTTNPQTGSNWTVAEIDALEAGARHTGAKDKIERVTQVWVVVDYTETPDHYAWSGGSNTYPYASWATAALNIQDAIDAASTGNTVWVRDDGIYAESITMKDGVDVVCEDSLNPPAIDGGGNTYVVAFDGEFTTGCTLDGFHISNGGSDGVVYLHGTGAGITSTTIKNCFIYSNSIGPGIKINGADATTACTIDANEIYWNSDEGLYIISAGSETEPTIIKNNTIRENTLVGINIGGASYLSIDNNLIYDNRAGVAFDTNGANPSSGQVEIIRNEIFINNTKGGIGIVDAITKTVTITQNEIHQNNMGGIGIQNSCTLVEITKNNIYGHTNRGGIHTGDDTGTFSGPAGGANLTIKQNKVHDNNDANYGGGIDVRHASGTIKNNLVYKNGRGGIRIGDYITEVVNNTVVSNGNGDYGGGIVYDNPATGAINDPPDKTYTDPILPLIKNNICAFNKKAGIGVVFDNSGYERNYNLLYDNWEGYGYGDCSWTGWPGCKKRQLGGSWPVAPNEIFGDPLFVDKDNDDYTLQAGSPAVDAGDTSYGDDISIPPGVGTLTIDMGAYGGPYGIIDAEIP